MSNLPALIKSFKPGSKYHITDDGKTTRCGHKIDALPETHALNIDESERCPRCGDVVDYVKISVARSNEECAAREAYKKQMEESKATNNARNAARPSLVKEVIGLMNNLKWRQDIEERIYFNATNLRIPVDHEGQRFTIHIHIWNGDKE